MALDHFVADSDTTRFSVFAFVNGCLNDNDDPHGYDSLSGACDDAKELAQGYYGEAEVPGVGADTLATPDVIITGPDGTEYVTRWIVQSVYDGEVSPFQYLITVETYEEDTVDHCRDCGDPLPDAGDGYDGRCGNCADAYEAHREEMDNTRVEYEAGVGYDSYGKKLTPSPEPSHSYVFLATLEVRISVDAVDEESARAIAEWEIGRMQFDHEETDCTGFTISDVEVLS